MCLNENPNPIRISAPTSWHAEMTNAKHELSAANIKVKIMTSWLNKLRNSAQDLNNCCRKVNKVQKEVHQSQTNATNGIKSLKKKVGKNKKALIHTISLPDVRTYTHALYQ